MRVIVPDARMDRWLQGVRNLKVKLTSAGPAECVWRRLQTHEQQAERERKNIMQKVMTFKSRAEQLMQEDCLKDTVER